MPSVPILESWPTPLKLMELTRIRNIQERDVIKGQERETTHRNVPSMYHGPFGIRNQCAHLLPGRIERTPILTCERASAVQTHGALQKWRQLLRLWLLADL